jgi:hypothetical protein
MAVTDATPTLGGTAGAAKQGQKAVDGERKRPSKRFLLICAVGAIVVLVALVAYRLVPSSQAPAPAAPSIPHAAPTTPTTAPNVQLPTGGATRDPFAPAG